MMLSLLTRPASDEPTRITSNAWVMALKEEIGELDQLHTSIFNDTDGEDSESSDDESRVVDEASAAARAARISSLGLVLDITDRKQSWEHQLRESSLAFLDLQVTSSMDLSQEQAQGEKPARRKRKANNAATRKKRVADSPTRRIPSPAVNEEEEEEDTIDVLESDICDDDVLGGRGGLSNHHVGNKRFRQIVADMKEMYRETGAKTDKTALSFAIVQYVHAKKGGRFLIKKPDNQGVWRTMTKKEARKKTSQALRETKELKWTVAATESPTQGPIEEV